ncbi:MAG: Tad domain-containing protein [Actinomycetota bacterium]|nr:Tad domain-containing protein [Actinomycetota bacterium]
MTRPPGDDERGQVTVLIVGFALLIGMLIAVVVDASAAYIQRQGLDTLADGAALQGANLAVEGEKVYTGGVTDDRLELTRAQAREAVRRYLGEVGAHRRYPGLTYQVTLDPVSDRVTVRLDAPLDLPLTFPGSPESATIGATGSAVVDPD